MAFVPPIPERVFPLAHTSFAATPCGLAHIAELHAENDALREELERQSDTFEHMAAMMAARYAHDAKLNSENAQLRQICARLHHKVTAAAATIKYLGLDLVPGNVLAAIGALFKEQHAAAGAGDVSAADADADAAQERAAEQCKEAQEQAAVIAMGVANHALAED